MDARYYQLVSVFLKKIRRCRSFGNAIKSVLPPALTSLLAGVMMVNHEDSVILPFWIDAVKRISTDVFEWKAIYSDGESMLAYLENEAPFVDTLQSNTYITAKWLSILRKTFLSSQPSSKV